MIDTQHKFEKIIEKYIDSHTCTAGKMMSSPALKFNNKVCVFYWNEKMGFRLGKTFDMEQHGIETFEYLSPFKNKPPMKAWYMIGEEYIDKWDDLTALSIAFTKTVK